MHDIAAAVGISKGNLTYHFPTKRDLARSIIETTRATAQERRRHLRQGKIEDDYVEHLLFAMDITWNNRFVLRDRAEFADDLEGHDSELVADFAELLELIERIAAAGMFRRDAVADIETVARSIWIVSRYWMDYLREFEGLEEITWADQERGIRQHYALLLPFLTRPARAKFESALQRTPRRAQQQRQP